MGNPEDAAKQFLEGLKTRKRQPWDDVAEYATNAEHTPEAPTPPPPITPRSTADDAMSQAERIAARNRDVASKTRLLRKD